MITVLALAAFLAIGGFGDRMAWAGDGAQTALEQGVACLCRPEMDGPPDWTVIALRAAGRPDLTSVQDVAVSERDEATTGRALALIALRAQGAAADDPEVGELVAQLQNCRLPGGKFADSIHGEGESLINAHFWAIIALRAADAEIPDPEAAYRWLAGQQLADGSFGYAVGIDTGDADMTAMALQALGALGVGEDDPVARGALDYLRQCQSAGGGFGGWGLEVTADSCAAVILGLIALGADPTSPEWSRDGGNPATALCALQLPDGGFEYAAGTGPNAMSTQQAVLALGDLQAGEPFWTRLGPVPEPQTDDGAGRRGAGLAAYVAFRSAVISGGPAVAWAQLAPGFAGGGGKG